jgi:hypothetical protein
MQAQAVLTWYGAAVRRYPMIDERFGANLRDLIGEMLAIDPARRPDLDEILKKNVIKRHIQVQT